VSVVEPANVSTCEKFCQARRPDDSRRPRRGKKSAPRSENFRRRALRGPSRLTRLRRSETSAPPTLSNTMGQQLNKIQKRRRRAAYLKRKKEKAATAKKK
jgi:hypothetical protein